MFLLRGNMYEHNIPRVSAKFIPKRIKTRFTCRLSGFINALLLLAFVLAQQPQLIDGQNTTSNILLLLNKPVKNSSDYCVVEIENVKVLKQIGSIWTSTQDACTMHSCELNKYGEPIEVVRRDNCGDFYCDIDSEIHPKKGTCCGECVRTKCRINDQAFDVNQTWYNKDGCTLNQCQLLPDGQPMINTYKKSCPPIPKNCPNEFIYKDNCCQYCKYSNAGRSSYRDEESSLETEDIWTEDIWTEEFYSKHYCNRECQVNELPKRCFYTFVVEWYETLSKACYYCPINITDCERPHCITGDGIDRSITVVNRMMPGPTIEVCQNDIIVVDVKNHLLGESTTIHWHGMHMKENPYMDGVPHITQCPISPRSTFRYTFKAENSGTHFWHSHTGMQRGDGVFGALIVKRPKVEDPHGHLYDFDLTEHKMIVQDWVHVPGVSMFASHFHSNGDNKPLNLLINGKGRYYKEIWENIKKGTISQNRSNMPSYDTTTPTTTYKTSPSSELSNIDDSSTTSISNEATPATTVNVIDLNVIDKTKTNGDNLKVEEIQEESIGLNRSKRGLDIDVPLQFIPLQTYTVKRGFRYRFRIINAEFLNCPIKISIDNHTLTAFNSDGFDFEAIDVGSIVTYAGERFDIVLNANQPIGNYWIRLKGLMDCDERFTSAFQVAILHYDGANDEEPKEKLGYDHEPKGIELNAMNQGSGHADSLTIAEIKALAFYDQVPGIDRDALKPVADYKFFVYYDFYHKDNPEFHPSQYYGINSNISKSNKVFTPQLNHISLEFPPVALLPARDKIDDSMFCNETTLEQQGIDCRKVFCKCHHVLQVPLNSIVELIVIDEGVTYDANHPFHLHGNAFRVVGLERLGSNVTVEMIKQLDRYNLLKRNLVNPPVKDTVTIPDGGYTIIRFEAYNPGFWLFHCHIEFHAEIGMALVLKVGDNEEMLPVPRNFPTCHDYIPDETKTSTAVEQTTISISTSTPLNNGSCNICKRHFALSVILAVFLALSKLWRSI